MRICVDFLYGYHGMITFHNVERCRQRRVRSARSMPCKMTILNREIRRLGATRDGKAAFLKKHTLK